MSWGNEVDIKKLESYFDAGYGRPFGIHGLKTEDYFLSLQCEADYITAYRNCPPLKSILGKRARAFNIGTIQYLNNTTEDLKPMRGNSELKNLIKKPNVIQSTDQFFAQQNIYLDIFGYVPVLKVRRSGFSRDDINSISALWNLPPWLFDLEYTRKWLAQSRLENLIQKYYLNWLGERVEIDMRDVSFIFDEGIGTDNDMNLIIPDSRLLSLEYPVSNIIAAYKSRNTLITKRGAIGILSNDGKDNDGLVKLQPTQKEEVQNDFKKYGLIGQPYQVIITDAALKWQQMGFPTKDLMLFEEIEDDVNRLCEAYNYPVGLMAFSKKSTFNNQNQDRKELYESIVPESNMRMDQFIAILPVENVLIRRDYSHLMIWQEDKKLMAEARNALNQACEKEYKNGLITKNQWLIRLGEEPVDDPEFEKYYEEPKEIAVPKAGNA